MDSSPLSKLWEMPQDISPKIENILSKRKFGSEKIVLSSCSAKKLKKVLGAKNQKCERTSFRQTFEDFVYHFPPLTNTSTKPLDKEFKIYEEFNALTVESLVLYPLPNISQICEIPGKETLLIDADTKAFVQKTCYWKQYIPHMKPLARNVLHSTSNANEFIIDDLLFKDDLDSSLQLRDLKHVFTEWSSITRYYDIFSIEEELYFLEQDILNHNSHDARDFAPKKLETHDKFTFSKPIFYCDSDDLKPQFYYLEPLMNVTNIEGSLNKDISDVLNELEIFEEDIDVRLIEFKFSLPIIDDKLEAVDRSINEAFNMEWTLSDFILMDLDWKPIKDLEKHIFSEETINNCQISFESGKHEVKISKLTRYQYESLIENERKISENKDEFKDINVLCIQEKSNFDETFMPDTKTRNCTAELLGRNMLTKKFNEEITMNYDNSMQTYPSSIYKTRENEVQDKLPDSIPEFYQLHGYSNPEDLARSEANCSSEDKRLDFHSFRNNKALYKHKNTDSGQSLEELDELVDYKKRKLSVGGRCDDGLNILNDIFDLSSAKRQFSQCSKTDGFNSTLPSIALEKEPCVLKEIYKLNIGPYSFNLYDSPLLNDVQNNQKVTKILIVNSNNFQSNFKDVRTLHQLNLSEEPKLMIYETDDFGISHDLDYLVSEDLGIMKVSSSKINQRDSFTGQKMVIRTVDKVLKGVKRLILLIKLEDFFIPTTRLVSESDPSIHYYEKNMKLLSSFLDELDSLGVLWVLVNDEVARICSLIRNLVACEGIPLRDMLNIYEVTVCIQMSNNSHSI
ncbi:hypothetical protein DASC09_045010 [Saccharomycopsis crataegensis]|uniref:Uncharacterized protein n=1 Tax=Saccharomycopsis crataegensis TaxID=43959 RepID=A0AAV5QRK6_9ASCO|nr:hypothetical protein DASC09_045010 [Saccharomycopsis crataegensis]